MPWELDALLDPMTIRAGLDELDLVRRLDAATADIRAPRARVAALEIAWYMRNQLLRDADWAGMAHSLEIRVPLLDQRLLDFALSVPGSVRLPPGARPKHLLRAAFPELLRADLQRQGKRGFELPVRRWMLGPLRELCQSGLETLKSIDVLRRDSIDSFWSRFEREPETPIWSRVFTLCVLGLYLKQNRVA
jgi:asparagine synthase (glutamine-hydrolysing)